jgi:hypothetical protein
MARKVQQPKAAPPVEAQGKDMSVRLYLPQDIHDRFRIEAAKQRTSMALLARRVVEDYVRSLK